MNLARLDFPIEFLHFVYLTELKATGTHSGGWVPKAFAMNFRLPLMSCKTNFRMGRCDNSANASLFPTPKMMLLEALSTTRNI